MQGVLEYRAGRTALFTFSPSSLNSPGLGGENNHRTNQLREKPARTEEWVKAEKKKKKC